MQLPLDAEVVCEPPKPSGRLRAGMVGSVVDRLPITDAERARLWRLKNKERANASIARWRAANPERVLAYNRRAEAKHGRKYQPQRSKRQKERYRDDPVYRIKRVCRVRYRDVLKSKGLKKRVPTLRVLGCTAEFLRAHIESKFKPGMNWNNHGQWEIDHIKPLGRAKTVAEVEALCHFTNLQPLWKPENRAKGDR